MNDHQRQQLGDFLSAWLRKQPIHWEMTRSAEDIASEFEKDVAFGAMSLANWLQTPSGKEVTEVVVSVLPFPYGPGVQLLSDALLIAASRQRDVQLKALRNAVLVGASLVIAIFFFGGRA